MSSFIFNKKPFNSESINGPSSEETLLLVEDSLNSETLNTETLNGESSFENILIEGASIVFKQVVGKLVSNTSITFRQDVELRILAGGQCVTFTQEVAAQVIEGSIKFCQKVRTNVLSSDIDVIINGIPLNKNSILTKIEVMIEEGSNRTATFALKVNSDIIDYATYLDGADVIINYYDATNSYRLLTGKIDSPEVDIKYGIINLSCSQRRPELIRSKFNEFSSKLGRYSTAVQGDALDVAEETDLRLQTIPSSLDFDAYNTPNVTSWYAKSTPDFTFGNGGIRYSDIDIQWQSRTDIVNTYKITVKYNYPRFYHWFRHFDWTPFYYNDLEDFVTWEYELPPISMITDAIDSNAWKRIGHINFSALWDAQIVSYTNPISGVRLAVYFNPFVYQAATETVFDETGATVYDSNGNPTYKSVTTSAEDLSRRTCRAANWDMASRFAQDVEETYTINLTSPQSIQKYGTVIKEKTVQVTADVDSSDWEKFDKLTAVPSGAVIQGDSYYTNQKINKENFNTAVLAAMEMARTEIVSAHRGTTVTIQADLKPEIEIRHTVEVNTDAIDCKGKVKRIQHTIDPSSADFTTTIDIAVMRAEGEASETPLVVPTPPTDNIVIPSGTISLGSHYGVDPATVSGGDLWNGHIGNQVIYGYNQVIQLIAMIDKIGRTEISQEFRVDSPTIPDAMRNKLELSSTSNYTLELVDDEFTSP